MSLRNLGMLRCPALEFIFIKVNHLVIKRIILTKSILYHILNGLRNEDKLIIYGMKV